MRRWYPFVSSHPLSGWRLAEWWFPMRELADNRGPPDHRLDRRLGRRQRSTGRGRPLARSPFGVVTDVMVEDPAPTEGQWRMGCPLQPLPSDWRLNPLGFARTG
jgi:hypothetical protein